MAGEQWIAGAIKRPGAFSAKAGRAGKSTAEYAASALAPGSAAEERTKKQAHLFRTLMRLRRQARK